MRGSVPTASGLKESQHASYDFDNKPIGSIIVAMEKKKVVEKDKRTRPSEAIDVDGREDVSPLRRRSEKRKDEKMKRVKEGLRRLREDA